MAINDLLIGDGATEWWLEEIERQLRRSRRDNNLEDERAEETEEEIDE